jgi:hypothetical protein
MITSGSKIQSFCFFGQAECVDKRGQFPVQHVGCPVDREIQAVIHNVIMVKVVGADAIAALTPPDLVLPVLSMCGFLFFTHPVKQPGTKNPKRFGFVFKLTALILANDNRSGRKMRNPDGAVSCIDALAAMAGRMENIDAKVGRVNVQFHFFRFGKNRNRNS